MFGGDTALADGVMNVLLFVPFGATAVGWRGSGRHVALTALAGFLLSLLIETLQYLGLPPGRSPALADVLCNAMGAGLGACLARAHRTLLCPDSHAARRLAWGWGGFATIVLAITAAALGSRTAHDTPGAAAAIAPSPFDYSPGFGWYGGQVGRVVIGIDAQQSRAVDTIAHSGSGPVVRTMLGGAGTLSVAAQLNRLDAADNIRSLVYLHAPGDSLPQLMLAQHGRDALLLAARRGSAWGLHLPRLRLAGALAPLEQTGTPVALRATVSPSRYRLSATYTGNALPAPARELTLTPLLGWALLQSVVTPESRLAPVVSAAWIALLVLPLAYWGALAGRATVVVTLALFAATLGCIPIVTGIHAVSWRELGIVLATAAGGMLLARHRVFFRTSLGQ